MKMIHKGSVTSIDLNLAEELQDDEFRDAFFEEISRHETAEQIRELRRARGKTQAELAELCDMKQSAISRLERPHYGRWNYQTFVRIANALKAQVEIRFRLAEDVIAEYTSESEEGVGGSSVISSRQLEQPSAMQERRGFLDRSISEPSARDAKPVEPVTMKSLTETNQRLSR